METRVTQITAKGNSRIKFDVIPGHFVTNHSQALALLCTTINQQIMIIH